MDQGNSQAANAACAIQRCECCRSQLEAHSFDYKPVPTTDEDGMRFHVVLAQVSSGGAPATNRHNPYSINPGLLDPRRRGLNGCCMSGEFLLLVVNPAPQPLPKTPEVIKLPWPAGRGSYAFLFECEWLWRSLGQYLRGKLCHLHK